MADVSFKFSSRDCGFQGILMVKCVIAGQMARRMIEFPTDGDVVTQAQLAMGDAFLWLTEQLSQPDVYILRSRPTEGNGS